MYAVMNATYVVRDGRPIILLFSRTQDGRRVVHEVHGFRPYFYAPVEPFEMTDLLGRRVSRIVVDLPFRVPQLRSQFEFTDEADIPFAYRFLIDAGIWYAYRASMRKVLQWNELEPAEMQPVPPRVLYFDIEVGAPEELFPRPEDPKWPIVTIQCYDSYTDIVHILTLQVEGHVHPWKLAKQVFVHSFETEEALISAFVGLVATIDPDILTGWNMERFDLPYLVRRARRLHVSVSGLSPVGRVTEGHVSGRACIDLLEAYQRWKKTEGELPTWDLKYVLKLETGYEYEDIGDRILEFWRNPRMHGRLLEYCEKDVEALALIDREVGLLSFYDTLRQLAGAPLDAIRNEQLIDYLALRLTKRPLPTKTKHVKAEVRGAVVLQPQPGLHEWVGVFDMKSLYPSLIVAFRISPEPERELMPRIVQHLQRLREQFRSQRRELERRGKIGTREYKIVKAREVAAKFLACSCFGVFAYEGSRLFDAKCANEITRRGRETLMSLKQFIEKQGYQVLYGDSVDPESPVFVLRKGRVHIIPIDEVQVGDLVWTGRQWKRVKRVIVKPKHKRMYRVVTHDGIVDVTEDHSLMQEGLPTKPTEVRKVDWIPFPQVLHVENVIDVETAWLIGFFLAEGSRIGERQYVINNKNLTLLERCQRIIERLTGRRMSIHNYLSSSRCFRISIPVQLRHLFDACYTPKGRKIVPWFILNAGEEVVRSFLDGFYAGDGDNEPRYRDKWKRIDQRSPVLAVALQFLLERLGYVVTVRAAGRNKMSWGLRIGRSRRTTPGEVKAVFPVETKYDYVVDIEVEDDHVFAVGHLLLHNTDSIFVRLNANGLDEAIDTGVYLENRINAFLRQRFQTDVMTCKFEKIYRRVFFKRGERGVGVKKRYAGWLVWKEGAYVDVVDIKGFEPKRSDTADYTREVMKRFFDILLRKGRDDALRFYRQCIEEFPKQPLWRIAIPKGVKFYSKQYKVENPWLRGSRWAMQHLGWRFREDQKPLLLYVRSTGGLPRTDVVCLPNPDYVLPDEVKVDMQKQLEKAFLQKFRDIIHSLQPTLDAWLR